jgi:DNA-binding LacI/PurR family transcriptional regulator
MSATIDDVADEAGVSKATVSRVFNKTATVSRDTESRVLSAIEKLNYRPNPHARKLAGGSGALAFVLQESIEDFFSNPFWLAVVNGFVTQAASEQQHPVLIFHMKGKSHRDLVDSLVRGNYDAVAFFGWHEDIKILERYIPENMRVVFGGRQGESDRFTYVGADNQYGGKLATSHLIEKGCKRILTITGDLTVESGRERLAGYKEALIEAGIKFDSSRVLEGDYSRVSARKSLEKYLKSNSNFDGIFAGNDIMAIEVLEVLSENGIRVPHDCKVIGFDGTEQASVATPPLSTISQPSFDLGRNVAAQLMLPQGEKLVTKTLPLELVVRASTGG